MERIIPKKKQYKTHKTQALSRSNLSVKALLKNQPPGNSDVLKPGGICLFTHFHQFRRPDAFLLFVREYQ